MPTQFLGWRGFYWGVQNRDRKISKRQSICRLASSIQVFHWTLIQNHWRWWWAARGEAPSQTVCFSSRETSLIETWASSFEPLSLKNEAQIELTHVSNRLVSRNEKQTQNLPRQLSYHYLLGSVLFCSFCSIKLSFIYTYTAASIFTIDFWLWANFFFWGASFYIWFFCGSNHQIKTTKRVL